MSTFINILLALANLTTSTWNISHQRYKFIYIYGSQITDSRLLREEAATGVLLSRTRTCDPLQAVRIVVTLLWLSLYERQVMYHLPLSKTFLDDALWNYSSILAEEISLLYFKSYSCFFFLERRFFKMYKTDF